MRLEFLPAARSETGRRPKNEDYYTLDESNGLFVVADGTASRGGARDAAEIGTKYVREALQQHPYDALFWDHCYGDMGHATRLGNRLLAENVAEAVLEVTDRGTR